MQAVSAPDESSSGLLQWPGDMMFSVPVRGVEYYRDAIAEIAGNPPGKPALVYCAAMLVLDDDNPHDPKAVSVWVEGVQIGHLPREYAPEFRRRLLTAGIPGAVTTCDALITKGLVTEDRQYAYCVELDLGTDPAPELCLQPTWGHAKRLDPDPVFQLQADGSYITTVLLERDALEDADKNLSIDSWTTEHWSTVNYYLVNRQHIGLGHRLFGVPKEQHKQMFGTDDADVTIESIKHRMAAIRLKRAVPWRQEPQPAPATRARRRTER